MQLRSVLQLHEKMVLLVGNGPSAWRLSARIIDRLRESVDLVVAACNATGARLSADITGAMDRTPIEQMLGSGRQFNLGARFVFGLDSFQEAMRTHHYEGVEDGRNLFFFERSGGGTGPALLREILACRPAGLLLIGFDGAADPRTYWQGKEGYKKRAADPATLDRWRCEMIGEIARYAADHRSRPVLEFPFRGQAGDRVDRFYASEFTAHHPGDRALLDERMGDLKALRLGLAMAVGDEGLRLRALELQEQRDLDRLQHEMRSAGVADHEA